MKLSSFSDTIDFVFSLSQDILSWRDDSDARLIHSPVDFKTEADLRAHRLLSHGLSIRFPSIPIISEEDFPDVLNRPDSYWLIDPIDGTSSWFHGFDGFVCQAALICDDIPLFGIIAAPALNTVWYGLRGSGAFKNNVKLPLLTHSSRTIIVDNTPQPHGIAYSLFSSLKASGYYESGSMGLKAVLVADGTVDLFVKDVVVRDWDLAPASVILNEVSGVLLQADGTDYHFTGSYEKHIGFLVARDPLLATQVLSYLL